jgi:hypothetical protein
VLPGTSCGFKTLLNYLAVQNKARKHTNLMVVLFGGFLPGWMLCLVGKTKTKNQKTGLVGLLPRLAIREMDREA